MDVDRFKELNEDFGHQQGDACLSKTAAALERSAKRPGDLVARYGGDEFVVVLPSTDLAGATLVAERMRTAIGALAIQRGRAAPGDLLTVSIGVASAMPEASSYTSAELLAMADGALLKAKEAGRDRIVGVELKKPRSTRPRRRTHPESEPA